MLLGRNFLGKDKNILHMGYFCKFITDSFFCRMFIIDHHFLEPGHDQNAKSNDAFLFCFNPTTEANTIFPHVLQLWSFRKLEMRKIFLTARELARGPRNMKRVLSVFWNCCPSFRTIFEKACKILAK